MKQLAIVLAVLALAAVPAHAQPDRPAHPKSEKVARILAVAGTLTAPLIVGIGEANYRASAMTEHDANVGIGFAIAGGVALVLAPSAGHWYAGQIWSPGLALRAGGAAAIGGVIAFADCNIGQPGCGDRAIAGIATAGVGLAAIVAGTVWDVLDAPHAARKWNERHGVEATVTPTAISADGHTTAGVAIAGSW